jgi:hypothetical protein
MLRIALWTLALFASVAQLDYSRKVDWNLPQDVTKRLQAAKFFDYYSLSDAVNPFYLRGDFDGDGKADYAILVTTKKDKKRFIAVCRSGTKAIEIISDRNVSSVFDPRKPISTKDDFEWMDAWQITDKQTLEAGELSEGTPPPMKGEGILAEKTESASVIIYWTGKGYHWYQTGD